MTVERALKLTTLGLLTVACTSEVEPLTPAQREAVHAYVSEVAPSPSHPLEIDFGGKVALLGYDLSRETWTPGETLSVTWYWRASEEVGKDTSLTTHLRDPRSGRVLQQDGNGTLRWLYGPSHWRPGQYVRDVQELHLPEDWGVGSVELYVGVVGDGSSLPFGGARSDGAGRALVVTVPTSETGSTSPDDLPTLPIVQTKRAPHVDGRLDDPEWSFARSTGAFVHTVHGGVAPVEAWAKLLWDARYLYVAMDVRDDDLRATDTRPDSRLWEQDCVELMIGPSGDRYFEVQVSPRGVLFDTRYDAPRRPRPFGHVDWSSRALASVSRRGELDDRVADAGYSVELAIPWQAFSLDGRPGRAPRPGDSWRANLYVMDLSGESRRAAAWSSLGIGDFHVPKRFGILLFEGPPEDMLGTNEPLKIPPGRIPPNLRPGADLDRGLREPSSRKRVR